MEVEKEEGAEKKASKRIVATWHPYGTAPDGKYLHYTISYFFCYYFYHCICFRHFYRNYFAVNYIYHSSEMLISTKITPQVNSRNHPQPRRQRGRV